jgi:hypothetical protein
MPDKLKHVGENLTDEQAEELLFLILLAITEYGGTRRDMTLGDFAEDVAMSMNRTTDNADKYRKHIEINLEG